MYAYLEMSWDVPLTLIFWEDRGRPKKYQGSLPEREIYHFFCLARLFLKKILTRASNSPPFDFRQCQIETPDDNEYTLDPGSIWVFSQKRFSLLFNIVCQHFEESFTATKVAHLKPAARLFLCTRSSRLIKFPGTWNWTAVSWREKNITPWKTK